MIPIKIAVCSKDERLWLKLAQYDRRSAHQWECYLTSEELMKPHILVNFDVFVLSDRFSNLEQYRRWFAEIRQQHATMQMILLISNTHQTDLHHKYISLCEQYDVSFILPGRGRNAIVEQIMSTINGLDAHGSHESKEGSLICFAGTTPNIGTTIIAFCSALCLAQQSTVRVGFLCLNLKSSKLYRYVGYEQQHPCLDDIRAELKAKSLTSDHLLGACVTIEDTPHLHVLFGNNQREQAEFYSSEEIEHVLQVAKKTFDICIVDTNAYWDNAATVCSMIEADTRIVVTTSEISHFQDDLKKWVVQVGSVFGITPSSIDVVVTRIDKQARFQHIQVKDIQKEVQMNVLGKVHYDKALRSQVNRGNLIDAYTNSQSLQEDITYLIHQLMDRYRLPRNINTQKKISRFKLW